MVALQLVHCIVALPLCCGCSIALRLSEGTLRRHTLHGCVLVGRQPMCCLPYRTGDGAHPWIHGSACSSHICTATLDTEAARSTWSLAATPKQFLPRVWSIVLGTVGPLSHAPRHPQTSHTRAGADGTLPTLHYQCPKQKHLPHLSRPGASPTSSPLHLSHVGQVLCHILSFAPQLYWPGASPTSIPTHLSHVGQALHHIPATAQGHQVHRWADGGVQQESLVGTQARVCDRPPDDDESRHAREEWVSMNG